MSVQAGLKSDEMIERLLSRRSVRVKAGELIAPAPSSEQLEVMLTAASRVPDHGMTCPYYFIVFEGAARAQAGEIFARHCDGKDKAKSAEEERERFMRAPLVVGVVHRKRMAKNPRWEQLMTAGAACQNLVLAANALGFGAQWMSDWFAYDADVCAELGLDELDTVAGFIYIGTPAVQPEERARPDLDKIVNYYGDGAALKKGDEYGRDKFGYPPLFPDKNSSLK